MSLITLASQYIFYAGGGGGGLDCYQRCNNTDGEIRNDAIQENAINTKSFARQFFFKMTGSAEMINVSSATSSTDFSRFPSKDANAVYSACGSCCCYRFQVTESCFLEVYCTGSTSEGRTD